MEFAIPLNKEDLLTNRACDGYSIKNLYDPAILGEKLEDYNAQFRNEGPISILNNFDVLYSLLHHSSRLKEDLKQQAWKILLSNVSIHVNSLPMVLHPDCVESEERKQQLCAFKMEAYILTQFVEGFESDAAKPDITADIGKKGKSVKKKSQMSWDWSVERNHVLVLINQLLQLDIQHLWDPPVVEEDFVNLFSGVCYKMLENPTVVRQKEDREMLINILGQLIKRYNHHLGASMKIIQLLQHFEHLVSPLAQALTTFVLRFGAKNLVCDVIREIGRMDSSDLSRDASGTRSFSQFIVEIAYKIPNQVLPNISLLMSHLDGDSYTMRNGVLGVFGEIVIKILSKEDLDDSMKKSREGFLDKLEEHIHDIHAFVRSKDLQVWIRLCQEKAIPISRQARIIDLVIGRLSDKSSQVRKYAVQFLKASLIGNPFAAKLPIEQLKSSLEKETEMLTQMDAPANLNGNEQESQQYITEMEEDSEKEPENQMELDLEALQQPQEDVEDPDAMAKKMELEKQKVLVNYLKACVKFAEQMRKAIPALCQLLQSKTSSDVLETIDFFIASHEFGLSHSEEGIRRMANLVWSRDAVVKKAVVNAFERLYIDISCENPRNKPTMIIQSLTSLINDANLGELTSLEELMYELMKLELIPQSIIHLLWQRFSLKIPDTSSKDQRIAITILSMIAGAEKDIIKSNLSVLAEYGFNGNDFLLARDTCTAIQKLLKKEKDFVGGEPFRLASDHNLFLRLEKLLTEGLYRTDQLTWTPFSEQALAVIYNLSESPDTITGRILKTFVNSLLGESSADNQDETGDGNKKAHPLIVARVLSAAGHIALLYLYHLDVSIFNELKRRHAVREEENVNKGGAPKAKIPNGRRKSMRESSASTISSLNKESGLDEEMGVGGAAAEDAEADYIRKICDNEVVLGQNLLSIFASVAVMICSNPSKFKKPELRSSAALTLAKFMLVSAEFCVQHLQLLFTILEKSDTPTVRSNMMIALGDLCFRFPNHIEPWTSHLYARLRDESVEVRKTTVTILTHLILNDMLKVKGQISEMAICLEDEEEKIASSAKMLFSELGRKGNALYNIAPDIISRLSDPDAGIDEKMFRTIMKFILQFIQKDKQAESLVEKLCHRFRATRTDRQWRDLSFCLSVLPYNEKTLKKLMENIRCYHDKLSDEEVFCFFTAIIAKSKKFAKAEFKTLVDEFESTLEGYHNKGTQENADVDKTKKALALVNDKNTTELNQSRKLTRAKSKSKLKPWELEDSDDNDQDCDDDGNKENRKTLPGKKRKTHRKEQKTVRLNPIFSSDDDDLFD